MKQQIISLLERAKESGRTIGDVLAEVQGMRPVCLTCDDHGAVGNILDTVPCPDCSQHAETKLEWITTPDIRDVPDCVLTPSGIALKQSQIRAQDGRTQVDNDLVSSLLQMASVAPASECEILQAAAAALASAPVAGEAQPTEIQSPRPSGVLSMDGASLHIKSDGSGQIIVAEDDFTLEDDRDEGPDGPQGSIHWVARLPASEVAVLRDFLTGHARPSDDALWDQTLIERDEYHDMADKLAHAIADHLLVEIGEHSSSNCPWMRALEAIESAAPQASPAAQPPQDFGVEMVSMSGTAPAVPRWLLDAAQRIQTYMDAHSPEAWAVGGIQKRQAPAADGRDALPPLDENLTLILGRPNFACAQLAQMLRASGQTIKHRTEDEQAAVIYFLLSAYLKHGAGWADKASEALAAIAAQQGEGGGV